MLRSYYCGKSKSGALGVWGCRLFGLLLGFCFLCSSAFATGSTSQQQVIDKELPGSTIVPAELISPDEDSPTHPRRQTVILGDFNGDGKKDFAAMVVKTNGKVPIVSGQLSGLAVCFGSAAKRHDCGVIPVGPIGLPLGFYLEAVKPGKLHCIDSSIEPVGKEFKLPDTVKELGQKKIFTKTAGIGWFRTMGNGDVVYVYQARKQFLSCVTSD